MDENFRSDSDRSGGLMTEQASSPNFVRRHLGKIVLLVLLVGAAVFAITSPGAFTNSSTATRHTPKVPSPDARPNPTRIDSKRIESTPIESTPIESTPIESTPVEPAPIEPEYQPRQSVDTSGFALMTTEIEAWSPSATLEEIADVWRDVGLRKADEIEERIRTDVVRTKDIIRLRLFKAACFNFEGKSKLAYEELEKLRSIVEADPSLAADWLYSIVFFQGVCALRRGEDENCILCRGESSCILPISAAAVHVNPQGSRLAIQHFQDYLHRFPDDLEVKWLLNLAFMTLGEYPDKVPHDYLVSLERWRHPEFDIGAFRDVGHLTKLNRFNTSGGSILDDFDNDGHLDVVVTSIYPTTPMGFYRNRADGTFEDQTESADLMNQLGGLNCVQTDYNNDGWLDIYIPRGAWVAHAMRPTLLRSEEGKRFTDVTAEAGLLQPMNSISAQWADYDNDGWLDLFVCCERQPNQFYHNRGDGTFESVAEKFGVQGGVNRFCKGVAWIDYDNDDYPDLYLNHFSDEGGQLFHNDQGKSFTKVTKSMGIDGPTVGFSCWAFDYDNDGWLDVYASCYKGSLGEVVEDVAEGKTQDKNKLYHNLQGTKFEEVSRNVGLNGFHGTMGSNFSDFDNDGYPDMYLGTGDPYLSTLVPNRMFKNVHGERFSEITASARTGNLQKGHGISCGDWDHDGDVDIFIQMGGAIPGDSYHNILFQNPGQGNHWLTVKLIGQKTNRPAIGVRLKAITDSDPPLVIHQHVSSGSSFGANALQRHLGLGQATRLASLEVHWPTSGTTQVFHDIPADQNIEITEFATEFRKLELQPIPLPSE